MQIKLFYLTGFKVGLGLKMKDQYAGDITDYIKFAFLRSLMEGNRKRLGIAWFHVAGHDGKTDGGHVEYLKDRSLEKLDTELFNFLGSIVTHRQRSIAALEGMGFRSTEPIFHDKAMPKAAERGEWFAGLVGKMNSADVVFTDPDNGITFTQPSSPKHIYIEELQKLAGWNRRPVICIQFPGRHKKHPDQIRDLLSACKNSNPCILATQAKFMKANGRTNVNKRWFIILNATNTERRIERFAECVNDICGLEANIHL